MFGTVSRTTVQLASRGTKATNVRTAVSLRDIRGRIKSITSIAKLTKTMQLVASSKMRSATLRAENTNHLKESTTKLLSVVEPDREASSNLIITVVSDKGMCGSVNNQSAKAAKAVAKEDPSRFTLTSVGTKASGMLSSEFPGTFVLSMKDLGKKEFTFAETSLAVDQLLSTSGRKGGYDGVYIIYNQFKNIVTYVPTEIAIPGVTALHKNLNKFSPFEFDEVEETTLQDLFEFQVASSLWGALNSNRNSEMAARMTSMDNATKNANKIVGELTVTYNRGRQAAITTELVEITSGASAVQESK